MEYGPPDIFREIIHEYQSFAILDPSGNKLISSAGDKLYVLGETCRQPNNDEYIIVYKDSSSFDTTVFQPSGEYGIYCLGIPEDSVQLMWGVDAESYQKNLLSLPSIENTFCSSDNSGGFYLHSGTDGSIIGSISGLNNLLITTEGKFIDNRDSIIQVVQISRNKACLYQSSGAVDVDDENHEILPEVLSLSQNYPNPFNSSTCIEFTLPGKSLVKLSIYNILGQRIATLADGQFKAGHHSVSWNGTDDSGREVPTGVYFYSIDANGNDKVVKKMLMLK